MVSKEWLATGQIVWLPISSSVLAERVREGVLRRVLISKEWLAIDLIIGWSTPLSVCTGGGSKEKHPTT